MTCHRHAVRRFPSQNWNQIAGSPTEGLGPRALCEVLPQLPPTLCPRPRSSGLTQVLTGSLRGVLRHQGAPHPGPAPLPPKLEAGAPSFLPCGWEGPGFKASPPRDGLPIDEATVSKGRIKACRGGFQTGSPQSQRGGPGCGAWRGPGCLRSGCCR